MVYEISHLLKQHFKDVILTIQMFFLVIYSIINSPLHTIKTMI